MLKFCRTLSLNPVLFGKLPYELPKLNGELMLLVHCLY